MDVVIDKLYIEKDRPAHIARHGVTVEEVLEVLAGDYILFAAKSDRLLVVGATDGGRFLAIIIGDRHELGAYGLVTARPAHRSERKTCDSALAQQGGKEDDDESNVA